MLRSMQLCLSFVKILKSLSCLFSCFSDLRFHCEFSGLFQINNILFEVFVAPCFTDLLSTLKREQIVQFLVNSIKIEFRVLCLLKKDFEKGVRSFVVFFVFYLSLQDGSMEINLSLMIAKSLIVLSNTLNLVAMWLLFT